MLDGFLDELRQAMQDWAVPGAAVGMVRDGRVLLAEGLGVRRAGSSEAVGLDTVFPVGSVTKSMTAVAFGLLVQDGRLGWDDRVADLLPGFAVADPYVTRELTVRDLLAHRSGVEDAPLLYIGSDLGPEDLLHRVRFLEQRVSLRSAFVYNNMLYLVLGALLQEVAGQGYADFMRARVFEPLGMARTFVGPVEVEDASACHSLTGQVIPPGCGDLDVISPAGAVRSTLRDLLEWTKMALDRGKPLLKPEILHEIHAQQVVAHLPRYILPEARFQGYALGSNVGDHRGRKVLPTCGRVAGATAEVFLVPESRLGVVALDNRDMSLMGFAMAWEAVDRMHGEGPSGWSRKMRKWVAESWASGLHPTAHGPTSREPQIYAGRYGHRLFGPLEIAWDGGLHMRYNREIRGNLEHEAFDTFAVTSKDNPLVNPRHARVTFRLDPLGEVEGLDLSFPLPTHRRGELERVAFRRLGSP